MLKKASCIQARHIGLVYSTADHAADMHLCVSSISMCSITCQHAALALQAFVAASAALASAGHLAAVAADAGVCAVLGALADTAPTQLQQQVGKAGRGMHFSCIV
jgi:hypothetical protein